MGSVKTVEAVMAKKVSAHAKRCDQRYMSLAELCRAIKDQKAGGVKLRTLPDMKFYAKDFKKSFVVDFGRKAYERLCNSADRAKVSPIEYGLGLFRKRAAKK